MDIDVMNNGLCKVCGEQAAGFHFGAFTCEGCKSFFGRTYNNMSSISECKNNSECVIDKKNRTSCKACRLKKCLMVGMSKSGSRYGRRSNWFKIHCMIQEQGAASAQMTSQMKWDEDNNNVKKEPPLWALPPHIPGMSLFGYVPPLTPFFLPRGLPLPPHPPPPPTPPQLPAPPPVPVPPVSLPNVPTVAVDPAEILRRLGPEQESPMDLRLNKGSPRRTSPAIVAARSPPPVSVRHSRHSPAAVISAHAQTDKKVPLDLSCVKHEPSVTIS